MGWNVTSLDECLQGQVYSEDFNVPYMFLLVSCELLTYLLPNLVCQWTVTGWIECHLKRSVRWLFVFSVNGFNFSVHPICLLYCLTCSSQAWYASVLLQDRPFCKDSWLLSARWQGSNSQECLFLTFLMDCWSFCEKKLAYWCELECPVKSLGYYPSLIFWDWTASNFWLWRYFLQSQGHCASVFKMTVSPTFSKLWNQFCSTLVLTYFMRNHVSMWTFCL